MGHGGRALVDVYVRRDVRAVARELRARGMRVGATANRGAFRIVEGWLPVGSARRAAGLRRVRAIAGVPPPLLGVGAKTSQGDAAHRGPQARALGPTGAGVNVGVISDSIDAVGSGVAGSQASGDLPGKVTVLSDGPGLDEGRAMGEIVYDEAPGIASILFGSILSGGPVGKAATIDKLVAGGADVIADDTTFPGEPFFQDDVVAQAVDRAVAHGTSYFTAAGNQARQSWEGAFIPSSTTPDFNDFDPGAADDPAQTLVTIPKGGKISVFLQWDEAFGHAVTDLDLFLRKQDGTPLAQSIGDNVMSRNPEETVTYTNSSGGPLTVAVAIQRAQGTGAPLMKYIVSTNFGAFTVAEHPANSSTIVPDAASSRGSITVAAVPADDPGLDTPESFSSRGPKTILFDTAGNRLATPEVRQKPEIAAADGVSTTVGGLFDPFFGTSAAAPSAAGVAALMLSGNPSLTPADIRARMTDPQATQACGSVDDCGAGFVFADNLVRALDSSPPSVAAVLDPPAPDGLNGFYTHDVAVSWSVTDPDSLVFGSSGCDPTAVDADTAGTTLTCSATSIGGTSAPVSVTIKRDASPPTVPVIRGIAPGSFAPDLLPPASAIGCTAGDPTSGLDADGCRISGYSRAVGRHTMLATARDNAGLTSVASLAYTVAPAISRLRAARVVRLKAFLRRGLLTKVTVARAGTKLTAELRGPRGLRVAVLKRTAAAGRIGLRLRPTKRGKALLLKSRRRNVLKLAVIARPAAGARLVLRRNVVVRR